MAGLSKSSFRSIAKRVFRSVLLPSGFEQQGRLFIRRVHQQVHVIDLQTDEVQFTFNLAFHYDFLPSFSRAYPLSERKVRHWSRFSISEYLMLARLGQFDRPTDRWFPIGEDAESAAKLLGEKANRATEIFDDLRKRWADPQTFLNVLTPRVLLSEVFVPEEGESAGCLLAGYLLHPFVADAIRLSEFCQILADRSGNAELRNEYVSVQSTLEARYKKRNW